MQLHVVNDEESVVEVIGVCDGETLVLAVELCYLSRRRHAAILADEPNLDARPFLRKNLQRNRIRIRVDKYDFRLRAFRLRSQFATLNSHLW